ncbi:MAG TPA: DegT/DnrJ/EryC1/StrS aminotransferase family protein [Acidobacteriota bacterium]|nr:DegT/DnrJ/EryC1/StrS aminotransferase family protein [Acidobacteriota bacterium]
MRARDTFLPFHNPSIGEDEISAVVEALREGWISSGPRVKQFEEEFAVAVGTSYAIAVNSGTAALHLALEALGVGEGDEVIIPVMTFAATAEAAIYLGARPVFVDCRPDSLQVDERGIARALTARTKAIVAVHYGGQACEMDPILELAKTSSIAVVEDAAHSFPASYKGRKVGTLGDAAAFSFYATKTLAVGEGGMLTTNDVAIARRAGIMRLHGITHGGEFRDKKEGTWNYSIESAGYKYNMPELQAAIGLVQLRRQGELLARRIEISNRYRRGLAGLEAVELPEVLAEREHAWHLFVIKLRLEMLAIDRDSFIEALRERKIGASVHFIPLHMQRYYADRYGLSAADFPGAEAAFSRVLSLPIWPGMSDEDVDDVVTAVKETVEKHSA